MFWWIVLAIVIVTFALAWWSSGRNRRGVDAEGMRTSKARTEGEVQRHAAPQHPYGHGGHGF